MRRSSKSTLRAELAAEEIPVIAPLLLQPDNVRRRRDCIGRTADVGRLAARRAIPSEPRAAPATAPNWTTRRCCLARPFRRAHARHRSRAPFQPPPARRRHLRPWAAAAIARLTCHGGRAPGGLAQPRRRRSQSSPRLRRASATRAAAPARRLPPRQHAVARRGPAHRRSRRLLQRARGAGPVDAAVGRSAARHAQRSCGTCSKAMPPSCDFDAANWR